MTLPALRSLKGNSSPHKRKNPKVRKSLLQTLGFCVTILYTEYRYALYYQAARQDVYSLCSFQQYQTQ